MYAHKILTTLAVITVLIALATPVHGQGQMTPHKTMIRRRGLIFPDPVSSSSTSQDGPTSTVSSSSPQSSSAPSSTGSSTSSSSGSSSGSVHVRNGDATHYQPGLGSCGEQSDSSEMVVALPHSLFDSKMGGSNPNNNPLCGKKVKASFDDKSIEVKVVDRCPGCGENDLDLSPTAFQKLAPLGKGRLKNMKWHFLD